MRAPGTKHLRGDFLEYAQYVVVREGIPRFRIDTRSVQNDGDQPVAMCAMESFDKLR
jgi:hypothetical protein